MSSISIAAHKILSRGAYNRPQYTGEGLSGLPAVHYHCTSEL